VARALIMLGYLDEPSAYAVARAMGVSQIDTAAWSIDAEIRKRLYRLYKGNHVWSPLLRLQHEELVGPGFSAPDFAVAARELSDTGVGVV
jgi:hypothetical protein